MNLHIKKGEFVAVIGKSGSGKSTLLNCMGLIDTPDEGANSYSVNGRSVEKI